MRAGQQAQGQLGFGADRVQARGVEHHQPAREQRVGVVDHRVAPGRHLDVAVLVQRRVVLGVGVRPQAQFAGDVGRDLERVRDFGQRGSQRFRIRRIERHALPALARRAQFGQRRAFAAGVDRQQVEHRLLALVPGQFDRAHRGAAGRRGEDAASGVGEEDGVDQLGLAARELGDEGHDQLVGQHALAQRFGDVGRRCRQQIVAGEEPGEARQFARQRLAPVGQGVESRDQQLIFRRHAKLFLRRWKSRRRWRRILVHILTS